MKPVPGGVYADMLKMLMKEIKASGAADVTYRKSGFNTFVQMMRQADENDANSVMSSLEKAIEDSGANTELFLKAKETLAL